MDSLWSTRLSGTMLFLFVQNSLMKVVYTVFSWVDSLYENQEKQENRFFCEVVRSSGGITCEGRCYVEKQFLFDNGPALQQDAMEYRQCEGVVFSLKCHSL